MAEPQKRKFVDCRQVPSQSNCSLYIAGTEAEVLTAAVRHAVEEHGHPDSAELREMVRSQLQDESRSQRMGTGRNKG